MIDEVFAFYRDGHRLHLHADRKVFEDWMEKSRWLYPPERCEIVRFVRDTSMSPALQKIANGPLRTATAFREIARAALPGAYLADGTKIKPPAILHPFYGQPEDDDGCSVSRPSQNSEAK